MEITKATMLTALEAVVEGRGAAYIYPVLDNKRPFQCFYAWEGEPSCGIGVALFDLGAPITVLAALDAVGRAPLRKNSAINQPIVLELLSEVGLTFTNDALALAVAFQSSQDDRVPYGDALAYAIEDTRPRTQ